MAKPDRKKGFLGFLPGFEPEKRPSTTKPHRLAMTVPRITKEFAYMRKRRMPRYLINDLRRNEFYPEQKEKDADAVAKGKRFSTSEWKAWRTIVRFEIDRIKKETHLPITPESGEETRVKAAVWKFRQLLPKEREDLLLSTWQIGKQLKIDLR